MSKTWLAVKELIEAGNVLVSAHGYDELAADNIAIDDVVNSIANGVVVKGKSRSSSRRHCL